MIVDIHTHFIPPEFVREARSGRALDRITWQGPGADCQSVPVKNVSWGRVKSLYR